MAAGLVAIRLGLTGPTTALVTACASGTQAVGEAFRMIRDGYTDLMVAGGAEAAVTPLGVAGFTVMKALSTRNEEPELASRPFDRDRDGFVIGEGAGVLTLEELEHALARGAHIYAELKGYAMTSDAYHMTAPHPEGVGAKAAMLAAIRDAGIAPEEVDYINAHGTSTPMNDKIESHAIRAAFGDHADQICVNSTKSMTGHLLGAAGGVEAAVVARSIFEQKVHPTINLENPGEECDLDYVPEGARDVHIKAALSNSFGFGGHNAVIVVTKYE
jgi:3-oxoacyl-[acyl-carrier-protein] synthase II